MSVSVHALAASYALDAVDELDRRRFETHLDHCSVCVDELAGFTAAAAVLGSSRSLTPPPQLRGRILAAAVVAPQQRTFLALRRTPRWRKVLPALAVAAALVVPTAAAAEYVTERENVADTRATSASVSSILAAPDASSRSTSVASGGRVRLMASIARNSAVVAADRLPALAADQIYQVWTLAGSDATSRGMFATSALVSADRLGRADRVAITVEPRGGSKRPTTAPVVTLAL